jgi:hypothetical protein
MGERFAFALGKQKMSSVKDRKTPTSAIVLARRGAFAESWFQRLQTLFHPLQNTLKNILR